MQNPSPSKQHKIRAAMAAISASLTPMISRVKAAKLAIQKALGRVPAGSASYNQCCPKGAGSGPASHTMAQKNEVGSRSFKRNQARFIKEHGYTEWGQKINRS